MNYKNYAKNKPDPSPVPGSHRESLWPAEDTAHASSDPWFPPSWMMPAIVCPFCHVVTPITWQTSCLFCGIKHCKECRVVTYQCEECGRPWPGTYGEIETRGFCCPNCFVEGRCPCGAEPAPEDDDTRPLSPPEKLNTNENIKLEKKPWWEVLDEERYMGKRANEKTNTSASDEEE